MVKNYLLCIFAFLVCFSEGNAQTFKAIMSGNNHAFPILSIASGTVNATLSGDTLAIDGGFTNLLSGVDTAAAGGVHIHHGIAGRDGDIQLLLNATISDGLSSGVFEVATNTLILSEDQKALLAARKLYVNVHSKTNANGELRGQFVDAAATVYTTTLLGSNHQPSVMTDAIGSLVLEVVDDQIKISGSFNNLSTPITSSGGALGIHIHAGTVGTNGPVVRPLTVELSGTGTAGEVTVVENTFTASAAELAALEGEQWYVNVHSQRFPEGELRGQITPLADIKMRSFLSGASQVPPRTSFALGKITVGLRAGTLTLSGSFSGLESDITAAHIHLGLAGRNGAVELPLTWTAGADNRSGTFESTSNSWSLSDEQIQALMGRRFYINIHTVDEPSGAIRGQILAESQYFFNAYLVGSQQVTPVQTMADGATILEVLGTTMTLTGSYQNLSSPLLISFDNGAHVHYGAVGSKGPHFFNMVATPDDDIASGLFNPGNNTFSLTETKRDSLRARLGYISVHSENFMAGELRGQLLHESAAYFYTPLSGAEQAPATVTSAEGAAAMEYNGNTATIVGSFNNLSGAVAIEVQGGSHIHMGLAGSNGPIIHDLTLRISDSLTSGVFDVRDNVYLVSSSYMDSVRQRMAYINVHSTAEMGGEIRGNFRPMAQNYYVEWPTMLGGPIPEMVDLFRSLQAQKSHPIYALTNWSAETFPIALDRYDFLHEFEGILVSGAEKLKKPDPAIYHLMLNRYNLEGPTTIFIDDNARNVAAANEVGLIGLHYTDTATVINELREMDVLK